MKYGPEIKLFNGSNLNGWRIIHDGHKNGFSAVNGELVNNPVQPAEGEHVYYGNLRTNREFGDFNLKLEVNVQKEIIVVFISRGCMRYKFMIRTARI